MQYDNPCSTHIIYKYVYKHVLLAAVSISILTIGHCRIKASTIICGSGHPGCRKKQIKRDDTD